ncbi:DUF7305 domain-containing protein [Billgrantia kenyensis]|uniref:Type 4 fimbrial biogenesis protein PilX N-terminal domain-containing protein n=1 Tax=Billgrantia kenyensis TaxID=321266 RepID=A0A7W0AEQ1_9GAMM|nr:PilX N-terminal domain-containing pilus assembly protein [Halomonas kenyensis]MBA2780576.1 hypothetical protein [Halomonas kenyensis]MCG6663269.1 hypothetical protein [Halomonas kenyensis]
MKQQRGAALVVVLSMLAMSLMLGLSGMQSSLIDERLAGNYRAASLAQMGAERAVAEAWGVGGSLLHKDDFDDALDLSVSELFEYNWQQFSNLVGVSLDVCEDEDEDDVNCRFYLLQETNNFYIVGMGAVDDGRAAVSELVFVEVYLGGEAGPFSDGVVGCEGVELRGSGRVDSYSSYPDFPDGIADGPQAYDPNNHNSNASVRTLDGGDVKLQGHSPIFGNVSSDRDVIAVGSAPIEGDIRANRDVRLDGNNTFDGNAQAVGDVIVNSGKITGDAFANANITFNNWGGEIQGNAQYGGDIFFTSRGEDHVGGQHANEDPQIQEQPQEPCDPLGIRDLVDGFSLVNNGPLDVGANQNPVLSEAGFVGNGGGEQGGNDDSLEIGSVDFLEGRPGQTAMRFSKLDIGSNGSLTIGEPDHPQHIVMVVDGDVNVSGGGDGLVIAEGSTLTLVVGGSVHLQGGVDIRGAGVVTPWTDSNGEQQLVPSLGIYSTADQNDLGNQAGVRLRGNTDMYATVYAPFADVSVGGSGNLFGSVRGRTAEFFGSGGMHYDEALGRVASDSGGETGDGQFRVLSWR